MNPEADRIAAKSYWRGDEEEQIKSQEGTWVWYDVPVIWTCPSCVFFQVWLSGLQTSSVALKFCDLPRAQCLCSSHSTWLSYNTTVSISGFGNMTWQNTHYQVGHLYIVCVKKTNKRVFYQRLSTAQQHPEQPGTARGRDLLWLPTDSFQFENKYWMLWLRVVYNAAHNMR